jgi:UDP-N-acetylmuramoylalanine--D-glutamate ligase
MSGVNLSGVRVVVVGMARSGVAAVELLLEKGARVTAVDQKSIPNARISELGLSVLPQAEESFADAELVVLSPGVPVDLDLAQKARARGARVVGDLELASWFLQGNIAGITGSNGKTTTTALTGHILRESGIAAQVGGNIGTPPCVMVASSRGGQWNVLELSSFQLETTERFRAHVGAALNVTADHLDRHYTMENYAEAKGRLFRNQRDTDVAVLNADDEFTRGYAALIPGTVLWFSSTREVSPGAWLRGQEIVMDGDVLMPANEVPLRGVHNLENALAAGLMAHVAGASHAKIREAVKTFAGVEHRLEFVRELAGVAWYNDSKATNVDATLKAIAAFPGSLWVILGGKDKDTDYLPLAAPLKEKAHAALLIGSAAAKIEDQLRDSVELVKCGTLGAAVAETHRRAAAGDTVLLAPACASFDQFENFEHRGREFKRLVKELKP